MTKRDYIALAGALRSARIDDGFPSTNRSHDIVAQYVADALANDSSRFDRKKFLAAAGVEL